MEMMVFRVWNIKDAGQLAESVQALLHMAPVSASKIPVQITAADADSYRTALYRTDDGTYRIEVDGWKR